MYDLRTNLVRWETNVRNGVCSIEFDRKDIEMNKMVRRRRRARCCCPCHLRATSRLRGQVLTTLESQFRVFDLRTCAPHTPTRD